MSRRSTRLKGVTNDPLIEAEDIFVDSDEDFDEEEIEEPEFSPTKKRRKGKATSAAATAEDQKLKKVRGRRGLLSSLKEFPLDVLFEIFGHLNPMDLLNLARTTKEIRGILMLISYSIPGLPPLPFDLSEPQYANLAFAGHCHKCFAIPVQTVIWSARTRMCKKCLKENFETPEYVASVTKLDLATVLELVPSFEDNRSGRRNRWRKFSFYSIDVATKLGEECDDFLVRGVLQRNDPAFLKWRDQKAKEAEEVNEHADLCVTWAVNRTDERSQELDDARRLRREAIVERLTALGWGEEIPFLGHEFNAHKLVRQPKELTNRIWKNIEAPLVELLTSLKRMRLELARQRILRERRLLAVQVYHKFCDTFHLTEPFRAVIEGTPIEPEEKVTDESFAEAISQVSPEEWKRCKDKELVEIMKKDLPNSTEADLELATAFFTCVPYGSPEPIGYPRILVTTSATTLGYPRPSADQALKLLLQNDVWNGDGLIQFHERAFRVVRSVLLACGLDPDVTTATEMDEIDPILECLNCTNETHGRLVMRWLQTAGHSCGEQATWQCLTPEDELRVKVREREKFSDDYIETGYFIWRWHEIFCCKFCDHAKTTYSGLKEHLATAHNVETMSLDSVKYHIDTPLSRVHPQPVRLLPPVEVEVKEEEAVKEEETVKEEEEAMNEVVTE
ncbi:hypothetical protein B0H17DRAFT_1033682 [Mycena rosella]|uniref:F-box domain-containing protein n=1 Tax=Mycena rosella TaxID=1033263 RepID=A0AAD7GYB4_MYCRO|nr:hypothetical protein B0H17DRAFT_1033682 [Mycena rosella]